jgi:hypothetical protein
MQFKIPPQFRKVYVRFVADKVLYDRSLSDYFVLPCQYRRINA